MTGQFLLNISRTTAILLVPKSLSSSMLLLLFYLRARSLGGSGAAVVRRRCWLASVFFTANSCHVPSRFAQFSPPIHCPQQGVYVVHTYACAPYVRRSADGGQLLHTTYIHSFSPALHANSRFLSGPVLPVSMGTWKLVPTNFWQIHLPYFPMRRGRLCLEHKLVPTKF